MRIALVNAFPNRENTAEAEFIARFQIASAKLGVECSSVVTSDDIEDAKPDVVLSTHEYTRKLTAYPTIGLIWSPLSYFQQDPYRVKSLLSYDGFLAGSRQIRTFLRDFQRGLGIEKPVAEDLFLPTSYETDRPTTFDAQNSICYIGVRWDGQRHDDLFKVLASRGMVSFYGPQKSWADYPDAYKGPLPFDGRSVQQMISSHGVALCLHRPEHRAENTPSMRIFEALSVGAIPICDQIEFARANLEDCAFFIDLDDRAERVADQIGEVMKFVNDRPDEAQRMATRGRTFFENHWSLEHKIKNTILPLIAEVSEKGRFIPNRPAPRGKTGLWQKDWGGLNVFSRSTKTDVDVVIRTGGRPLDFLRRAVQSVADAHSPECRMGVLVVDYAGREDVRAFVDSKHTPSLPVRYIRSPKTGFRSTALWDGLKAASAPYVCHLDDDDTVFPNHYRQLIATLDKAPDTNVAYTGVIKFEEEDGHYVFSPNFEGNLGAQIPERRELKFLENFDLPRLARIDNYIQSNGWMARTSFVQSLIGGDPEMVVTEDVYLYLLMASRGPFAFTGSPTAVWHWRSSSRENSMLNVDQALWIEAGKRTMIRLANVPFVASATLRQLTRADSSEDELDRKEAQLLPPLNLGQKIEGGIALSTNLILERFHRPEMEGVWTSASVAGFRLNPGSDLRQSGGFLIISLMGAVGKAPHKWIEIEVEGGEPLRLDIYDWSIRQVSVPISAGIVGDLHVLLRISEVHRGTTDDPRHIGIYVKSVTVSSTGGHEAAE